MAGTTKTNTPTFRSCDLYDFSIYGRESELDFMMVQRVALLSVVGIAFSACFAHLRVSVDKLAKALEAPEEGRNLWCEVDQHLILLARVAVVIDQDRRELAVCIVREPMREKTLLLEDPEQTIEVTRLVAVGYLDEDTVSGSVYALHESACEQKAVPAAVLLEGIEIDPRHSSWPLRSSSSSVSRDVGRPVAPFSFPLSQATPAMSRWAHGYFFV